MKRIDSKLRRVLWAVFGIGNFLVFVYSFYEGNTNVGLWMQRISIMISIFIGFYFTLKQMLNDKK